MPVTDEQMMKMWYIHKKNYDSALKKKAVLLFSGPSGPRGHRVK